MRAKKPDGLTSMDELTRKLEALRKRKAPKAVVEAMEKKIRLAKEKREASNDGTDGR